MKQSPPTSRIVWPGREDTRGFTLVEAVMSMLIVGLMLVAALNTVGASKVAQSRNAEQAIGPSLAESLMTEILGQVYEEPDDTPEFGRESEPGGDRTDWDDVDDYNGWSASPPQAKDGTDLPDLAGWGREVTVVIPSMFDLNSTTSIPNGLKRIDVKVTHNGRVVSQLSAVRSYAWDQNVQATSASTSSSTSTSTQTSSLLGGGGGGGKKK